MKLKKVVLVGSILLGLTSLCRGQQITGSSHDFTTSNKLQYNSTGEVCIVCHAPHGTDGTGAPLWNHHTTTQIFTTYTGYKFLALPSITQPDGASKLCLSCHDGVSAINQFGGISGGNLQGPSGAPIKLTSNDVVGLDLSISHPISFVYDKALSTLDPGLRDPTTATTSLGGTIKTDLLDINGKMQCPSCHEVHDPTYYRFLKMSNAASALCLTCHNK